MKKKECLHEFLKEDIREFKIDAKCVFCHETMEKLQPKIIRHHFVAGISEAEEEYDATVGNDNLTSGRGLVYGCFFFMLVGVVTVIYFIYIGIANLIS